MYKRDTVCEVFLCKNDDGIDEKTFEFMLGFVCDEKRKRILKQKKRRNAENMLIGEVLAKVCAKKVFGKNIEELEVEYASSGKPFFKNFPEVHFNISHSGNMVVCAVGNKPIGIDVQKISERAVSVAERVCNEEELTQIEKSHDRDCEFIRLWTAKEARLKMLGCGIAGGDIKNCLVKSTVVSIQVGEYWISVAD